MKGQAFESVVWAEYPKKKLYREPQEPRPTRSWLVFVVILGLEQETEPQTIHQMCLAKALELVVRAVALPTSLRLRIPDRAWGSTRCL